MRQLARPLFPAIACALFAAGPARAAASGEPKPGSQQIILVAPRVLEIAFEGADSEGLQQYLSVERGAPLDLRDVRDSVRALHGSGRFARVAAWSEDVPQAALPPGWSSAVRLIFVLTPIRKLVAVNFPGHQSLAEGVLRNTANLPVNSEYQPESIPRAIDALKSAYKRIGYEQISVTPEESEGADGVQLALRIEEGPATRVSEIVFTGQLGLTRDQLAAALQLHAGDILNLSELDDGLRGLRARYRAAGYLRARVGEPQLESVASALVRLKIPVEAGPPVAFVVRGNRVFDDELLVSKMQLTGEEPLDAQSLSDLANRLRGFYVQNGFPFAHAAWRELHAKDGSVQIVFAVDEGPRLRVEEIEFTGVDGSAPDAAVQEKQLRELVLDQLRDNLSSDPAYGADMNKLARSGVMGRIAAGPDRIEIDPDTVFDPGLYLRARNQMTDLYKSLGYLSARVETEKLIPLDGRPLPGPPLPPDGPRPLRHAKVVIPVSTGLRTFVSKLIIEGGAPEVSTHEADAAIVLRTGKPFNYLAAEEGRSALTTAFNKKGYFFCHVEDEESFNDPGEGPGGRSEVEVRYRVQPGPLVRVAYVEVTGQQHTQESLIRELVGLKPGDLLTPEAIDHAQQQLLLTGLFFSATLTPRNPEVAESEKTILVTLRERPRREVQVSGGFSYADGPRVQVQWTQGNLGGRNLTFSALGRVNFPFTRVEKENTCPTVSTTSCVPSASLISDPLERLIDFGLAIPRLEPITELLRGSVDLIHERDVQYTYERTKYSTQLSIALNRPRPFGFSLAYEVGYQELTKGTQTLADILSGVDQRIFTEPDGHLIFGSLRPTLTLDLRDDPGIPRSGFYAQLTADYFRSIGSPSLSSLHSDLIKLQGLAAFYVPLPWQSSILLHGSAGEVFGLPNNTSLIPGDRRFYLGGAATLRGFNQDALQPQDLRDNLRQQVKTCNSFLTNIACTTALEALQQGAASSGGSQMVLLGVEWRVPIPGTTSLEIAFFYDAGNLWSTPINLLSFSQMVLRDAVGFGIRWGTPIGRLAVDIGFNLNPDKQLGEPVWAPYFNVDTL